MKKVFAVLLVSLALVLFNEHTGQVAAQDAQDEAGVIPSSKLRGNYSDTLKGSFAVCLSPTSPFPEESCSTKGALVIPLSIVTAGHVALDKEGNSCETGTQIVSGLPVDISPPQVTPFHNVEKRLNYDPTTGTGDASFTTYVGGTCHGAKFDSTGATVLNTGTIDFVASDDGKSIKGVITSLTDPVGGIGDFSLSNLLLRQ